MNALVRKEIRLLMPSWATSLLLALSIWLLPKDWRGASGIVFGLLAFPILLCPTMLVMMTLGSFGREFSAGTFSMLLVQPIPRARIWWTKTLLLAAAVLTVWLVWCASYGAHDPMKQAGWSSWRDSWLRVGLFALVLYSGGLWTVLLVRQVAAAFWFTILVPAALFAAVVSPLENYPESVVSRALAIVFTAYVVIGFLWARWLFLRAQDVQWTGGAITLPRWRRLPNLLAGSGAKRKWHPRAALFFKELQLHQSQLLMAGVLALLHLSVNAARTFGGGLKSYPYLEFVHDTFWLLWFVMPVLVGCAAVAEERKLGTLEGQLCLPVKRREQFAVKLLVVFLLSIVLGAVVPLLLERNAFGVNEPFNPDSALGDVYYGGELATPGGIVWLTMLNVVATLSRWLPFLGFAALATGLAAISFYASTLSRNTLQALTPAVLGIIAASLLLVYTARLPEIIVNYPLWRGWLPYLIGVPVLTLTLAALAFKNYRHVLVGWNVWRKNLLTIATVLALVMIALTAIYQRAWEWFTPLESPHGTPRLTQSNRPTLRADGRTITVVMPDGRVWLNAYSLFDLSPFALLMRDLTVTQNPILGDASVFDGTNWAEVVVCSTAVIGIQKDGSLWAKARPDKRFVVGRNGRASPPEPTALLRLGADLDWNSIARCGLSAVLLKNDRTLWHWGTNRFRGHSQKPELRAFQPQRLGTESDWAQILCANEVTFFRKTDGRVWAYPPMQDSDAKLALDDVISLGRASYLDHDKWHSLASGTYHEIEGFQVAVCENGTFWELATRGSLRKTFQSRWTKEDVQLGKETNWLAAAGGWDAVVTLKADGSLWRWTLGDDPRTNPNAVSAVRLGTHSDWVAIAEMMDGVVSLAADGSLRLWRFEPRPFNSPWNFVLLGVSRKPELLGNILDLPNQQRERPAGALSN